MTRIVTRDVTPGLDPTSFGALPRTLYRVGTTHVRVEELPDPEDKVHLMIVRTGTDAWMVDRMNKTVKHHKDLPAKATVPVFARAGADLELGHEIEWMKKNDVTPDKAGAYRVKRGDVLIELIAKNGVPHEIHFWDTAKKPLLFLRYDKYERNLPAKMELFQVPPGMQVQES
jgi:hypothetical protein